MPTSSLLERPVGHSSLRLRFFDATADIACESATFRAALAQLYRPALKAHTDVPPLQYRLGRTGVSLCAGGNITPLARGEISDSQAHALLFTSVTNQVRSHWLLHAAALAGPTGGLLLVGASGAGKTTLALALARRGYGWFTDEAAAIGRQTGCLAPFPRAARLRPGTLQLLPDLNRRVEPWQLSGDDAVGCWHPAVQATPVPVRYVFLLGEQEVEAPTRASVSRLPSSLSHKLANDPDLSGAEATRQAGAVVLTWPAPLHPKALMRLAQACRETEVLLLNTYSGKSRHDFSAAPRVLPCPASIAWLALAGATWNRPAEPYPGDVPDREGRLAFFRELAAVLQDAECYRLHPGPLAATVTAIERITGGEGGDSKRETGHSGGSVG